MRKDVQILIALLLLTALYAAALVVWAPHPFEDAAILMRYAQHAADGHGIVWNIGEPPVDGATDFLFMLLVAGLARCGVTVESAVRLVGIASHFLTVAIVYIAVRRLHGARPWMAALSAGYLAVGPGLAYASAYFGTPFFVLFACLAWWLASEQSMLGNPVSEHTLARGKESYGLALLFALCGLAMGLVRPEGVFLAAFMLAAVVFLRGVRSSWRTVAVFVVVFAVLGGAYFAWRWSYFGHPLPNPFYRKGGWQLHWDGLKSAVEGALRFSLPFTLPFIAGFRSRRTVRQATFALIPVAGFVALWVLLSSEMNYHWRFQYAILPIVLLSWPPLTEGLAAEWHLPRWSSLNRRGRVTAAVLGGIVCLWALVYVHRMSRLPIRFGDGNHTVAMMLREYSGKGYTMAVTEAGLLPLYSRWNALDAWGLNDPQIARAGRITAEDLDRHKPHLIIFHAYFSPLTPQLEVRNEWDAMVKTLKEYAESKGYRLAAVFGETPHDTHHYYVRPDFADSGRLFERIRDTRYIWMSTGGECLNFATLRRGEGP